MIETSFCEAEKKIETDSIDISSLSTPRSKIFKYKAQYSEENANNNNSTDYYSHSKNDLLANSNNQKNTINSVNSDKKLKQLDFKNYNFTSYAPVKHNANKIISNFECLKNETKPNSEKKIFNKWEDLIYNANVGIKNSNQINSNSKKYIDFLNFNELSNFQDDSYVKFLPGISNLYFGQLISKENKTSSKFILNTIVNKSIIKSKFDEYCRTLILTNIKPNNFNRSKEKQKNGI